MDYLQIISYSFSTSFQLTNFVALSRILYYLILKPLSYLPLGLLYVLSDVLAVLVYYVFPYRKKVVEINLRNSFPDKTEKERRQISRKFYSHLCDIIVEGVKLFSISRKEANKRLKIVNPEVLDTLYNDGKSVILVGAHYNNWEIVAMALDDQLKHRGASLYSKLNNSFFNEKFKKSRTKYGLKLVSTEDTARYFVEGFEEPTLTVFISDQSPTYNKTVHWTKFLNQDTAVATGTERFAKKYNLPVVFGDIMKVKRGYYTFNIEMMFEDPKSMAEGEISRLFTKRIEDQILSKPEYWLWTHKRWKRKPNEQSK